MPEFISLLPVWQLWLVAALILFALEVITPGFILACFGVGALLAIIPAIFGGSWLIQAIFFGVGSLLALWLLKPLMARWFAARDTKTGMDAPIGRVLGKPLRYLLAWGDLLMMRKQLLTLAALAERDAGGRRGIEGGR